MATLNIKDFPDALYDELKSLARQEGRSLAGEVTYLLAEQVRRAPKYTLDDWRGVGAEAWKGRDVARFVDRQRKGW